MYKWKKYQGLNHERWRDDPHTSPRVLPLDQPANLAVGHKLCQIYSQWRVVIFLLV